MTAGSFQIRKGLCQDCILPLSLFNFYAVCSMWNARLDETQAWTNTAGRNINKLREFDDITLMTESEEIKSLDENERAEWTFLLKNSIFRELRSWHLIQSLLSKEMEKQWKEPKTLFWVFHNYCRCWLHHEIKRRTHGKKAMTKLDSMLKSRDIALSTKVHIVKAMVFLAVMYGCEIWTPKIAGFGRFDAFKRCCWWRS